MPSTDILHFRYFWIFNGQLVQHNVLMVDCYHVFYYLTALAPTIEHTQVLFESRLLVFFIGDILAFL